MAQMPRGQARSVPDPDGELYDEMLRQERLKRSAKEVSEARYLAFPAPPYSLSANPDYRFLFEKSRPEEFTVGPDGRMVDSRNTVHPKRPLPSPAELGARRAGLDRVNLMAGSPLAGAVYGIASVLGASPQTRDRALAAGGIADATLGSLTPFGASRPGQLVPPRTGLPPQRLQLPAIRYRELNEQGQARGVNATLSESMLGMGTKAYRRRTPPGWQGHGIRYNEARAHLAGKQLGADGKEPRNLVTLTQNGANTPQMRDFENQVRGRIAKGEVVEYSATPIYSHGVLPPHGVLVTAYGPQGATARYIQNPAGRPR